MNTKNTKVRKQSKSARRAALLAKIELAALLITRYAAELATLSK